MPGHDDITITQVFSRKAEGDPQGDLPDYSTDEILDSCRHFGKSNGWDRHLRRC